jgi:hypothetical protein
VGAKKFGASNAAVLGALLGGIIGAIIGFGIAGVGILLGAFLGIFLGAFLVELILQRDFIKSIKVGVGGVVGRIGSILAKIVIALVMLGITVFKIVTNSSF